MGRNWQPSSRDAEALQKAREELDALRAKTAEEMSARFSPRKQAMEYRPEEMPARTMRSVVAPAESVSPPKAKPSGKFSYDRLGRLAGAKLARRALTFERNKDGLIQSALEGKNRLADFVYDKNGLLTGAKVGKRMFTFNRNTPTGRIQSVSPARMERANA